MPIDPSIISGLKQPQFDTSGILNVIAQDQQRRIALENHRQQTELHQQAIAAGERAAKAADLKLSEDAISRGALQESGGDMDKYVELVRQRAKSPDTIQAAQTHQQAILKGALANQKEQGAVTDAKNERMAGLIDQAAALKKTDPAAYAQSFPQIHADIKSIDPDASSHLDPNDPESLHLPAFALHYASLKWGKQVADLAKQQADEARAAADAAAKRSKEPYELAEVQGKAAQVMRENTASTLATAAEQGRLDQALAELTPEQQQIFGGIKANAKPADIRLMGMKPHEAAAAITAATNAENNVGEYELRLRAAKGDATAKKALADASTEKIRVASVEAQSKWNLQMGAMTTKDGEPSELAKSVADYSVPLTQALSRIPAGVRETVMQQIRKANPDFRAENYDAFRKTEMDATTGKLAQTSNAQSTALAHLEVLHDAALALKNSDIRILNKLANGLGVQTGSTAKTTYDAIVHKVGPELSSAYIAGGGAVGERGATEHDFSSDGGPKQILDNIAISANLLAGKVRANQEQYQRGTYGRGKQELLSKEAASALKKLSGGDAPPLPSSLSASDKGKTFTNSSGQKITVTDVNPDNPKQFKFEVVSK